MQNAQSAASKANGALMRATPLAIWAHRLPAQAIAAAAAADARLSHPNQATQDANAAYVIAVASLVRQPGDAAAALEAAEGWAAEHACSEVQQWLAASRDDSAMQHYQASPLIGFAKHAFQLAFYHLRQRSGFVEGLRHTLLAGGDTGGPTAVVLVLRCFSRCCGKCIACVLHASSCRLPLSHAKRLDDTSLPISLPQIPMPPLYAACWARYMAPRPFLQTSAPKLRATSGQPACHMAAAACGQSA